MHRDFLKGHWDGGRDRTKCILINYRINKGGPSQVGGSYSWLGGGGREGGEEGHLPHAPPCAPPPSPVCKTAPMSWLA